MLKPTQDFVLLELCPETSATKTGVIIPASVKNRRPSGKVLAVGPGSAINSTTGIAVVPVSVAIGEVVVFNPNGSYNLEETINGELVKCVLLREREILGVE